MLNYPNRSVLGHEFAGVTEAGQRVAVDPAVPCGNCEPCLAGNPNLCLHIRFAGYGEDDGALRDMLALANSSSHSSA